MITKSKIDVIQPWLMLLLTIIATQRAIAQSVAVVPPPASYASHSIFPYEPPNDLTNGFLQTEAKLAKPLMTNHRSGIPMAMFQKILHQQGIKSTMFRDARDVLNAQTEITIPAPGFPIATNLRLILENEDCTYQIDKSGVVVIFDEDDAENYLTNINIDITQLTNDHEMLKWKMVETIDPDCWEWNGGMSRAEIIPVHHRQILSLAVNYSTLKKIRHHFSGLNRVSGKPVARKFNPVGGQPSSAKPVVVPPSQNAQEKLARQNRTGGIF